MTAELVSVEAVGGLPGKLVDQGYVLPPGLPYGDWETAGLSLRMMHRNINWWVGDWLRYGESEYGEEAYQATLSDLATMLGRGAESLGQCAWVASRFPPGTRVPTLSWSHHRAVLLAGLSPEQGRELLAEAVKPENGWSVAALSDQAQARAAAIDAQAAGATQRAVVDTDGAPAAVSGPWAPTVDDLTPAARQALEYNASRARVQPYAAARIWIAALVWAEQRDAFTNWPEG